MRFVGLAAMLALVLSGCGGGSAAKDLPAPASATAAKSTAATPTATASATAKAGIPAPAELSGFQCGANAKGSWAASGVLRNDTEKAATYQVSVFVGQAAGLDAKARTKEYANVAAGGSIRVELARIPAAKGATQCYVQVLRR